MENIINTIKYTPTKLAVLFMATLVLSVPMIASAQFDSGLYDNVVFDQGLTYPVYDSGLSDQTVYDFGMGGSATFDTGMGNGFVYDSGMSNNTTFDPGLSNGFAFDSGMSNGFVYDSGMNNGVVYDSGLSNSFVYDRGLNYGSNYTYQNSYAPSQGSHYQSSGSYYQPNYNYSSAYYRPSAYVAPASNYVAGTNYTNSQPYYYQSNPTPSYVEPVNYYYYNQPVNDVQPTYTYAQPTLVSNQVLAYTDTSPSLDSIYLSDIPSTGFDDYYGIIIFISMLVSWSAIISYIVLKRKIQSQMVLKEVCVDANKAIQTEKSVSENLLNNITSDSSDINKVEEYARMNKVLLSSDASIKIVKLARNKQINASEYIRSVATGEWIAIGEALVK